jgi:hypothetical protein
MPDRSRKQPEDENEAAARIVREATEDGPDDQDDPYEGKNPAAVELGRLGGLKGGPARAKKLSKQRRIEIARKAAEARWKDRPSEA